MKQKQYEYIVRPLVGNVSPVSIQQGLNKMGEDGWEVQILAVHDGPWLVIGRREVSPIRIIPAVPPDGRR